MAINLTDALNAATTKGKLANAKQIYLEGDNKNLQDAHKDNEDHLSTLDTRSTQIEESLKTIAATGGASNANAVIYDNSVSGLTAINVKGALDELAIRLKDGFLYKGIATPTTNPGTPNGPVFYIAAEPGVYPNFSSITVGTNEVAILVWNNGATWKKEVSGFVSHSYLIDEVTKLDEADNEIKSDLNVEIARAKEAEEANAQVIGELRDKTSLIQDHIKENVDLDVSDENGNIILRLKDGHLYVQKFRSDNTLLEGLDIVDGITPSDFQISDLEGNVLAEFKGGHIRTKEFDSRNTVSNFKPRPSHGGKVFFSVNVNINLIKNGESMSPIDTLTNGTDYGFLALPSNYTTNGKPTRLIINCHGASVAKDKYTKDISIVGYESWLNLGFAVMDMYGIPYEISHISGGSTVDNSELHFGNPVTIQCYKKGYEYVVENYNICKDGVFVIGTSMGGMSSVQIIQSNLIPVLAYVGYCPLIDTFKQAYCNPWVSATFLKSRIAEYFGFEGTAPTWSSSKPANAAEVKYFKDNLQKVLGYYPIFRNVVSGDVTKVFDFVPTNIGVNNDFTGSLAEEQAFYDSLTATCPCPVLVFHCKNDGTVAYRYSKYWIEMLKRSGQIAYLRTFTTGGHNAWDNGSTTVVKDINGNDISLTASKYEAYLFFKRFNS